MGDSLEPGVVGVRRLVCRDIACLKAGPGLMPFCLLRELFSRQLRIEFFTGSIWKVTSEHERLWNPHDNT